VSGLTTFAYELYNKLEIDINKVNKEKLKKGLLPPKPFKFILENVDTSSEENPSFRSISQKFYRITISSLIPENKGGDQGNKTIGIKNESFSKFLGGMYQNVNVYNNFIPVFDLNFISRSVIMVTTIILIKCRIRNLLRVNAISILCFIQREKVRILFR
jgi:hypothetical protein